MFSLRGEREASVDAELVGKGFLLFQIHLRLMKLTAIDVGDRVGDDVDVEVLLVLMHTDQALMPREELLAEFSPDLETLLRRDLLVMMEADDVVCIHSSGVFIPEPLFRKERSVDIIVCDL